MKSKQAFSKTQINIDLNKQAWPSAFSMVFLLIGMIVSAIGLWFGSSINFDVIFVILFSALNLLFLLNLIGTIAHAVVYKRAAKHSAYTIVVDEISSFENNCPKRKFCLLDFAIVENRHHKSFLYFKRFGAYCVPTRGLYTWSKQHEAGDQEVALYSSPNEEYYIVTADGKYPLMVYNTKLFEYKDE